MYLKRIMVVLTLAAIFFSYFLLRPKQVNAVMKICFNTPWKNLHPGTQNTMVGGIIISQQFESLIKIDPDGNVVPGVAKAWQVSEDFKIIKFKIDETKKFANGKKITTDDVFNSWVNSFNMSKTGPNNSLKDVLGNIVGFEPNVAFEKIDGLKKINDVEFEIHFKNSFRMAIYHLRGARFAIYTNENGNIIGSGKYEYDVNSVNNEELDLVDRENKSRIIVKYLKASEALEEIKKDQCDVFFAPSGGPKSIPNETSKVAYVESEDAVHLSLILNTKNGIFTDVNMRRAFLYLINNDPRIAESFLESPSFGTADPQLFGAFSQGRLSAGEVEEIILAGKNYVPLFFERLGKNKIKMFVNSKGFLEQGFKNIGVSPYLIEEQGDAREVTQAIYNGSFKQDLTAAFLSVLSFDPDGIYHALGEHGAILNPYISNIRIFKLLEEGRSIVDRNKLDGHYQEVTRIFLKEVPFIHLGFGKNALFFNNEKVSISKESFRNTLDFSTFKVK